MDSKLELDKMRERIKADQSWALQSQLRQVRKALYNLASKPSANGIRHNAEDVSDLLLREDALTSELIRREQDANSTTLDVPFSAIYETPSNDPAFQKEYTDLAGKLYNFSTGVAPYDADDPKADLKTDLFRFFYLFNLSQNRAEEKKNAAPIRHGDIIKTESDGDYVSLKLVISHASMAVQNADYRLRHGSITNDEHSAILTTITSALDALMKHPRPGMHPNDIVLYYLRHVDQDDK